MALKFNSINDILNGRFDKTPTFRKKEVRIFLSSTFTDTYQERDYLIEKIFPRLKEYCRSSHDLDFQPVDMRWGIASDAYEYHGTSDLCLNEIENCKKLSIGPNFVTLIGQKYGLRPIPTFIDLGEYEILTSALNEENVDISIEFEPTKASEDEKPILYKIDNILKECYKLDTNSIPNLYRILPISQIITTFHSDDSKIKKDSRIFWDMTKLKLLQLLRTAAHLAYTKKQINKAIYDRYFVSITEKEIFEGILNTKNPNKHSLAFIREIEGLEDNLGDSNLSRFIDTKYCDETDKEIIDAEAQDLLSELKNNKLSAKIDAKTNIFQFKVKWKNNQIDKDLLEEYLMNFGETFFVQIKRLIDQAVVKEASKQAVAYETYKKIGLLNHKVSFNNLTKNNNLILKEFNDFLRELNLQIDQFKQETSIYHGRDYLLEKMKEYILNDSLLPFVITGESGCGKTSLMGHLHQKIPSWVDDPSRYIIITRFLGTTRKTSTIFQAYKTIGLQLHYLINLIKSKNDTENYKLFLKCKDVESLTEYIIFNLNEIKKLDPNKRIVLIIDSLDQLLPNDFKSVDQWLLTNIPDNTKYLVSTIPDHGNLLNVITKMIKKKYSDKLKHSDIESQNKNINEIFQKQMLNVKLLEPSESEDILGNWLLDTHTSLSDLQWNQLKHIFKHGKLSPLFLKLLFDIVSKWRSYDQVDDELLKCLKVDDIIYYRFGQLEKMHGKQLFRRAISYMTICKNGITDGELENILSLDEDVLYAVFEFSMPPIRRVPTILWIRIKKDLARYIVEKEANDAKVVYWHHRKFVEVTLNRYVKASHDDNNAICQNILEFYDQTWTGKPKPFRLNEYLTKKYKKAEDSADRLITPQPTTYVTSTGITHFNKRKICEMPYCISNMSTPLAVEKACELVFFNFEFLRAKLIYQGVTGALDDLKCLFANKTLWNSNSKTHTMYLQLKLLQKLLIMCGAQIDDDQNCLGYQLTSRLLYFYGKQDYEYVTCLIDAADKDTSKLCSFLSPYHQQQVPGGFLISNYFKHKEAITKVTCIIPYIFTYSMQKINVYLVSQDTSEHLFEVKLPKLENFENFVSHNSKLKKSSPKKMNPELLNSKKSVFKCVFSELDSNPTDNNPNLFPVSFLIIRAQLTYIVTANKQLKFLYIAEKPILDVYMLEPCKLIVIEENECSIKIFSDYELEPLAFVDYPVCDDHNNKIQQAVSSNNSIIDLGQIKVIDLVLLMHDGEIRQYLVKSSNYAPPDLQQSPANTLFRTTDNDDLYATNNEAVSALTNFSYKNIGGVNISLMQVIKPSGLHLENLMIIKDSLFTRQKSDKLGRVYFSTSDNSLVIIQNKNNHSKSSCCLFKQLTKQPIVSIAASRHVVKNEIFTGSFKTKDYLYLVHTTSMADNHQALCKIELKERVDFVEVINEKYYILCRNGIIELYKLKCLGNKHRVRLIFSINSLSRNVTDLTCFEHYMYCATNDGVFNFYNMVFGKKNEKIYPSFDRTYNLIHKIYCDQQRVISISKLSEIALWDISNGLILKKFDLDKNVLGTNKVVKLKMYFNLSIMLILMKNGRICFYKSNELVKQIDLNTDKEDVHNFLIINSDDLIIRKKKSIKIIDTKTFDFHCVDLNDGLLLNDITLTCFNPIKTPRPPNRIVIYLYESDSLVLLDKSLKNFLYYSPYTKQFNQIDSDNNSNNISKFVNRNDETSYQKFFSCYPLAKLKYKVLYCKSSIIYLSISVLNEPIDADSSNSRAILSTIVVKASMSATANNNMEFLVLKVYPFCRCFEFTVVNNTEDENIFFSFNYVSEIDLNKTSLHLKAEPKFEANLIQVWHLKTNLKLFELDLKHNEFNVDLITLDSMKEYLMFFDNKKFLWLYRLKDKAKLACLYMYGLANQIKFSSDSKFACLNMSDRKIYTLMLIDPDVKEHKMRIKELPSRYKREITSMTDDLVDNNQDFKNDNISVNDEIDSFSNKDDSNDDEEYDADEENNLPKTKLTKKVRDEDTESLDELKKNENTVCLNKTVNLPFKIDITNKDLSQADWLKNYLLSHEDCAQDSHEIESSSAEIEPKNVMKEKAHQSRMCSLQ